jgi:hypothetical protein
MRARPGRCTRPRAVRLVLAAALVAAVAGLPAPAGAQQDQALVRVGHFSRVTGPVDVWIDGGRRFGSVPFRAVSDYLRLDPGGHDVAVRQPGAGAAAEPLASTNLDVAAGEAGTVALVGARGRLELFTAEDDLSPPPAGMAKVRGIHASPEAPAMDVRTAGSDRLFQDLTFPEASDYELIPGGDHDVELLAAGTDRVLVKLGGLQVRAGGVYTVVGAGNASTDIATFPLVDALGAGTLPRGGIGTGGGGTAGSRPALPAAVALAAAALLAAAAGAGMGLARRRAAPPPGR